MMHTTIATHVIAVPRGADSFVEDGVPFVVTKTRDPSLLHYTREVPALAENEDMDTYWGVHDTGHFVLG